MRGLLVSDLMTWPVVTAGVGTTFKSIVSLLTENGISAIPVIDEHKRVVGEVGETDLLARYGRGGHTGAPASLMSFLHRRAWKGAPRRTAGDLMTRQVRTVGRDEPVASAARRLVEARLRRLYVVDGAGRLVGVLARRDVLRAFLRPDDEIKEAVEQYVLRHSIWADPSAVEVRVDDGVVTLDGSIDRRSEVLRATALTESVPGVIEVRNRLRYALDDAAGLPG